MPNRPSKKGELAREYLLSLPDVSKKEIGKRLFHDHPTIFKSAENARSILRYHTDSHGKVNRDRIKAPLEHNSGHSALTPYGEPKKHSKILVLDIETSPILGYVWGFWEQNLSQAQIVRDWFVITWSAKWLFDDKVYEAKLTSKEALVGNDERIMRSAWEMINEADIIIGHNMDRFDIKKLNTRFIFWGMNPPTPFISIDTLKVAKKSFAHSSNKLEYINSSWGIRRKMEHEGFPLWKACCEGDTKALKTMSKYNTQDIIIQEEHYLYVRAWIKPHPNLAINITNDLVEQCPTCESEDLLALKGRYTTNTASYNISRCNHCGALSYSRGTQIDKQRAKYIRKSMSK